MFSSLMTKGSLASFKGSVLILVLTGLLSACGGGGYGGGGGNGGGGGGGGNPPATPTGFTATPGNASVALTWTASSGATSYTVSRSTTSGGPYSTSACNTSTTSCSDSSVTNGTTYYYVVAATNSYGTSANSSEKSATPVAPPATPTGLKATAGNQQVMLTWNASSGANSYNVGRSNTSGGPYTTVASPAGNSYTDANVTNGTPYYYVVAAVDSGGASGNSGQVFALPAGTTTVRATVDVLADRNFISPYVYGVNFPPTTSYISNSNTTLVRWGGNASSTYNWTLGTYNADNDYFFEDFTFCGFGTFSSCTDSDSSQWITDVKANGGTPLMTMAMLPWVAQSAETPGAGGNLHWSFSVSQDGACASTSKTDQYNRDAGVNLKADCSTTMVASNAQLNRAYFPLLDDNTQACPTGNCVYRNQWAAALATAFGSGSCPTAYSLNTSCHFYDMDNEIDIWGGTHVDVHPNQTTYNELRDVYLTESAKLKTWDPQAIRFGWVSCCWGPYWNPGPSGDKASHANIDFMPWWINEVYWNDQISGLPTLNVFDLHAYPETSGSGLSLSQQRVLALNDTHDWWDPTYTSQAWFGGVSVTNEQPNDNMPFRIPRVRALLNSIYPGTPLAFTEWNFAMAGESDFSTALADADAYGILGRERVTYSTRWTAPDATTPAYNSLLLYRNYDGSKSTFNPISVSATHNGDPNLFSVYAASSVNGNSLTLMVVNKDPANNAQVQFTLNHFSASQMTTYTLSQASPNNIVAASSQAWPGTITVPAYSATLLVVTGSTSSAPASEWDLNPDAIMVPANGTAALQPRLVTGSATVTLNTAVFDSFEGATTCNSGSLTLANPTLAAGTPGDITVNAPASPGFCHFSVTASDGTTKGGWIVVGKPAATLAKNSGDGQIGTHGTALASPLVVTLMPGQSGGSAAGASVLFTTSAGSLTNVQVGSEKVFTGTKVIAVTNSSGSASVTLTLPAATGPVTVHAEGPYGLGHPVVPSDFNETSN